MFYNINKYYFLPTRIYFAIHHNSTITPYTLYSAFRHSSSFSTIAFHEIKTATQFLLFFFFLEKNRRVLLKYSAKIVYHRGGNGIEHAREIPEFIGTCASRCRGHARIF